MAEDHVKTLTTARDQLLADRRSLAGKLAKGYVAGKTEEEIGRFVVVQQGIDAIDRALRDERFIAAETAPESLVAPLGATPREDH